MPIDSSTAFVSYSREDLDFVLRLTKDLKAKGAKVWMDKLDLRAGKRWELEVDAALSSCGRMLVVLSPASVASGNVMAETGFAIDEGKEVIPVLYRDCRIPFRLRPFRYADFRSSYDEGLEELLASMSGEQQSAVASAAAASSTEAPSPPPTPPSTLTEQEQKLKELQSRAETGDSSAMLEPGNAYRDGQLVAQMFQRQFAGMAKLPMRAMPPRCSISPFFTKSDVAFL